MTEDQGIGVIYRWRVESESEKGFIARWTAATLQFRADDGSLGSCLLKAADGDFYAFARWPSEAARRTAFARLRPPTPWAGVVEVTETELRVVTDLLSSSLS